MDPILLLWPWRGAVLAFLVALAVWPAAFALRMPRLGMLAAGLGVLAGWWLTFGLLTATPRQLPERLPLLMLILLLFLLGTAPLAVRWPRLALPLAVLGALAAGWWMAGAPLTVADLRRVAPVLLGMAGFALLLALRADQAWRGAMAAGALLAGLVVAGPPGPWLVLAAIVLAASLGAWAGRAGQGGVLAALPLAGAIGALGALPVIARGRPADWAVAAAPLAALWLGPVLAPHLPGRVAAPAGALIATAICLSLAYILR